METDVVFVSIIIIIIISTNFLLCSHSCLQNKSRLVGWLVSSLACRLSAAAAAAHECD